MIIELYLYSNKQVLSCYKYMLYAKYIINILKNIIYKLKNTINIFINIYFKY